MHVLYRAKCSERSHNRETSKLEHPGESKMYRPVAYVSDICSTASSIVCTDIAGTNASWQAWRKIGFVSLYTHTQHSILWDAETAQKMYLIYLFILQSDILFRSKSSGEQHRDCAVVDLLSSIHILSSFVISAGAYVGELRCMGVMKRESLGRHTELEGSKKSCAIYVAEGLCVYRKVVFWNIEKHFWWKCEKVIF